MPIKSIQLTKRPALRLSFWQLIFVLVIENQRKIFMFTEIKTWHIIDGKLKAVGSSLIKENRTEQYNLETWIASNPSIIGPDIIIIGSQAQTKSGLLDLLGIDKNGNLIIIELKRDRLPREALVQAINYASDISHWDLDKISEICVKYTGKNLEDVLNEQFPDISLENLSINETQRIILVGFSIDSALERMINWLSDKYSVNINVILLSYIKTQSGNELINRTSIISEEAEQEKIKKIKIQIPMSDEPGNYDDEKLRKLLKNICRKVCIQ